MGFGKKNVRVIKENKRKFTMVAYWVFATLEHPQ